MLSSEFDTIPLVVEDSPDFINSLKQVKVALDGEIEEKTIMVEVKGPGELTAGDLGEDPQVTVLNPELKLATLMDLLYLCGVELMAKRKNLSVKFGKP